MSMLKGLFSDAEFTVSQGKRWLFIQSSGTAEEPSGVVYQSTDGTTHTKRYTWFDQDGNFRVKNDTAPTDEDAQGTVYFGSATTGANLTLSNLGTVAFATDLLPGTTATYDLGSTTKYIAEVYSAKWLGHANSTITATDGLFTVAGKMTFGADGGAGNKDILWYGHTATSFITFDETEDALTFEDDTLLKVGTGNDFIIDPDGTDVAFDCTTDDTVWDIGGASDVDVKFHSHDNADQDAGWISDIYTWQITDNAILQIGGAAFDTVTTGFKFIFDGTATMNVDAITAEDSITFGETVSTDLEFHGTNYDIHWDASEDELIFKDNVEVIWGTGKDLMLESDGTLVNGTFAGTTSGIVLAAYAAQTTAAIHIDGATNDWDGADNVGMLHLSSDAALIHAGATLLYIGQSTAKPINSAQGFLARFEDSAPVATTTPAYAVEIDSTNNFGLNIVTGKVSSSNLVMSGIVAQTAAMLSLVGTTGAGWDGADGVGMLNVAGDGAHAHANASLVNIVDGTGASIASGRGTSLRIVDTTTVGADSWVAYIDTTANDGLLINTGHAACINLKLTGLQAQTAPQLYIDGRTGTGWDGADDVGLVHLISDSVHVNTGATMLSVQNSACIDDAEGNLARFVDTSSAGGGTTEFAVEIHSTNNEALNVSSGVSIMTDGMQTGSISRVATNTGATTGTILTGESFIDIDCDSDANHIIILPAPVVGRVVWLQTDATGCELRTSAHATVGINGSSPVTNDELALAASCTFRCVCTSTTNWLVSKFSANGTEATGGNPDSA